MVKKEVGLVVFVLIVILEFIVMKKYNKCFQFRDIVIFVQVAKWNVLMMDNVIKLWLMGLFQGSMGGV